MTLSLNQLMAQIKNGLMKRKRSIKIKNSTNALTILQKLKKEGFIRGFAISKSKTKAFTTIFLKYTIDNTTSISNFGAISKVERRKVFSKIQAKKHTTKFAVYIYNNENCGEAIAALI